MAGVLCEKNRLRQIEKEGSANFKAGSIVTLPKNLPVKSVNLTPPLLTVVRAAHRRTELRRQRESNFDKEMTKIEAKLQ